MLQFFFYVCFIFFSGGLFQLTSSNQGNHRLCSKITSGDFKEIHFQSITPVPSEGDEIEGGLMIYASDLVYSVPLNSIGPDYLSLTTSVEAPWSSGVLSMAGPTVKEGDLESLASVYFFTHSLIPRKSKFSWLASVVTDYSEYLFSVTDKMLLSRVNLFHPTFSLILEVDKDSVTSGFVIHKDIYDGTGGFILYEFELPSSYHPGSSKLPIHSTSVPEKEKSSATFYYIEKTADPNKVAFVRSSGSLTTLKLPSPPKGHSFYPYTQSRMLFQPRTGSGSKANLPPIGYKHGNRIYLLDEHLGCVYVIRGLVSLNSTPVNLFLRRNVPYEQFFLCDPVLYPKSEKVLQMNANRCKKNVFKDGDEEDSGWSQVLGKMGVFLAGFFFILFILGVIYASCSKKKIRLVMRKKRSGKLVGKAKKVFTPKRNVTPKTGKLKEKTTTPTTLPLSTTFTSPTATPTPEKPAERPAQPSPTIKTPATTLPPLGTPPTAPPSGRASFKDRVKATAKTLTAKIPNFKQKKEDKKGETSRQSQHLRTPPKTTKKDVQVKEAEPEVNSKAENVLKG